DRDADHGECRLRGQHPGQVSGPACTRDDHAEPAACGLLRVTEEPIWCPVRRDDLEFRRHTELVEDGDGSLECREVGAAAANDADDGAIVRRALTHRSSSVCMVSSAQWSLACAP